VTAPRRLALLAAFAVPAIAYVASASPEPASWDTAELQGVPYILGISHPTGFPFYVLLGYLWSHAFALGSVAWRMNAMSGLALAVAAAAACACAFEFGASALVALPAALWFAFTQDVWSHAARAEAQDLAVACCAVAIYAFVRWLRGGTGWWFVAAFALCGLGMAAHPNAIWILPAFIAGALIAKRRPPVRLVSTAIALLIAGLALYLYLPLRSQYIAAHHLDPVAALPGAGGGIFWNYNDPRTLHGLALEVTGSETETPQYFLASFNPIHLAAALWAFIAELREQYDASALLLIFTGFVAALRRDWRAAVVVCMACTAALLFSVVYPNESDVGRYRLLALWLAVPLLGALTLEYRGYSRILQALLVLYLAAGASLAFVWHRGFLHHAPAEGGRWVIAAVRPYVPAGAVIVTGWLDATSLAYGAYVDRSLPGRIIVSDDRLDVPLYRRWAQERRVFVLVDPHDVTSLPGAQDYATLDGYHELYAVTP
jgi:4-amino-4-deoxy-L-arabinose transferase-like glycosyltransferase